MTTRPTAAQKAEAALAKADEAVRLNAETNALIKELHDAWMKPHPGYGNRALIDCVSDLVVETQSGKVVASRIVWYAKVLGALAVIGGAVSAVMAWGSAK